MKMNDTTSKQQLSLVKRTYLALEEMQAKCEAAEQARCQPIAIVGLACRLPGADNSQAFWDLLAHGGNAVGAAPAGRWSSDADANDDPRSRDKTCAWLGGYLHGPIDEFDPHFFGISPREARSLDPQQRLLLEVSWEALEHAGQIEDRLAPNRTGVFVGITSHDYSQLLCQAGAFDQLDPYFITGSSLNAAAGRLSYTLGFHGPCMAIDTACSSSLVAIHQACRSLLDGECDRALAGGVNLILSPLATIALSRGGVLATDGRCKAFDASADGMVRGEGCAVIVLKRLTDALAAADNVLAVIRGSAVNQDGASSGLTVPNGPAQEAVIRQALAAARLTPDDMDYVEAHGTGTSLGDPIEAHALSNVFGRRNRPLIIGSVKTNIGHLEAASGVAGVVKVVLALLHRQVPAHLHFENPSPHIRWDEASFLIPTRSQPWPVSDRPRLAGVSSFGFCGTNAHLIVGDVAQGQASLRGEAVRNGARNGSATSERPLHLLALSAKTKAALVELARRYEQHLAGGPSAELPDLCFTANAGRGHWHHRLALVVASMADLRAQLSQLVADGADVAEGERRSANPLEETRGGAPRLAMLYTEHGADMDDLRRWAREFRDTQPTFRAALERCQELLRTELEWPLLDVLFGERQELLDRPPYASPAMASVQYALGQLWTSWGVRPSLIVGRGIGEYVAACCAGVMSLHDALILAVKSASQPTSLAHYARQISYRPPQVPFLGWSGTAGDAAIATPEYWSQLRHDAGAPFNGLDELQRKNCPIVLSVGDNAASNRILDLADLQGAEHAASEPLFGWRSLLEILAALYRRGVTIDWRGFDQDYRRRRVALPTYPFQRERYWHEIYTGPPPRAAAVHPSSPGHPLLGQRLRLAGSREMRFDSQLNAEQPAFLQDHRVFGNVVFPVAALLEIVLAAGAEALGTTQLELREVVIEQPLVLPERETVAVQTVLTPRLTDPSDSDCATGGEFSFEIFGRFAADKDFDTWNRHMVGIVARLSEAAKVHPPRLDVEAARRGAPTMTDDLYHRCRQRGIELGHSFRTLRSYWRPGGAVLGHAQLPDALTPDAYIFHPALFDGGLQVLAVMASTSATADDPHLPVGISRFRLYQPPGAEVWSYWRPQSWLAGETPTTTGGPRPESLSVDLEMVTATGEPVATIEGLQLKAASRDSMLRMSRAALKNWLYRIEWRTKDLNQPGQQVDSNIDPTLQGQGWLVVAASAQVGGWPEKLAQSLKSRGATCTLVSHGDEYRGCRGENVVLDPLRREHFQRLLSEHDTPAIPLRGIVVMGESLVAAAGDSPSARMEDLVLRDCASMLHLVQAIVAAAVSDPPTIWTVGCRAQAVLEGEAVPGVSQAALWGLVKTIRLEHPELDCRYADLDPAEGDAPLDMLCAELVAGDDEQHVAFRSGHRHVARLASYVAPPTSTSEVARFRADGSYLITGGLRGLGLEVASWMARRGAGRLVLVGRSAASDESLRRIDEIRQAGTVVDVVQADVSDSVQIAALLDGLADGPTLRGVIHCAIVLDDGILMQQTAERFRVVLAPKVAGAWNLHKLTRQRPLDFFLLFSSAASLLGSAAQGSYCAANAFLDSLAEHRRSLGLPAVSINWGPWSGTGTVARGRQTSNSRDLAGGMRDRGIQLISPRQGLQILEQLLADSPGQVAVLPGNWSALAGRSSGVMSSLLRDLVRADGNATNDGAVGTRLRTISGSNGDDRRAALVQFLRDHVAAVLRSRPDQIEVNEGLNMLGLDSLMAVELRNRVNTQLGIDVPVVKFMAGLSVVELADDIDGRMPAQTLPKDSTHEPQQQDPYPRPTDVNTMDSLEAQQLLARLDDLSDEEVEALLTSSPDPVLAKGTN